MNPLDEYKNEKWSGPPIRPNPVTKLGEIKEVEEEVSQLTDLEKMEQKAKVHCENRMKQRHMMKKIEKPNIEEKK